MTRPYFSRPTSAQLRVLTWIANFKKQKGFPPTGEEIAQHFEYKSRNAADCHVRSLERHGLITRVKGISRGIKITENGYEAILPPCA